MDARDLKVFETVARLGGMGRAAEALHTVQSNVTARVRHLEQELGTSLFERYARGVEPTPAGRRLLPYAVRIAQLLEEARRAVQDDGTPQGPLVVGSLETTAALRLSPVLTQFAAAYPAVDLTLRTGTTCELLEQVLGDKVEGAFVCGPVAHPDLAVETIFREELALLTAPHIGGLEQLTNAPDLRVVVLRRGCSFRQRLEDILARRGVPAPRILEFGTLEAIFACVSAGLGVTLLPRSLVGPVWREGHVALHQLPPADALVETVFVRRRDGYIQPRWPLFSRLSGRIRWCLSSQPIRRGAEDLGVGHRQQLKRRGKARQGAKPRSPRRHGGPFPDIEIAHLCECGFAIAADIGDRRDRADQEVPPGEVFVENFQGRSARSRCSFASTGSIAIGSSFCSPSLTP